MNSTNLFDISGKVAIVTGGARGLGRFLATGLAEAGANVIVASRKLEKCEEAARELATLNVNTLAVKCDMASEIDIEHLVKTSTEEFGRIDILVNNAGITWGAPTLEFPLDKWDKVFNINVRGLWSLTQKTALVMREQEGGKIINISSVMASRGSLESVHPAVPYNSSKAAVEILTKNLAVKLAPFNINVNCIAPGFFRTDMMEYIFHPDHEGIHDLIVGQIPANRIGGENDMKAIGLFLASNASNYVTGAIIPVDGGMGAM
jgi:gluconate 5-dehydrogenase